jgi:hypothetical protein
MKQAIKQTMVITPIEKLNHEVANFKPLYMPSSIKFLEVAKVTEPVGFHQGIVRDGYLLLVGRGFYQSVMYCSNIKDTEQNILRYGNSDALHHFRRMI